LCVIVEPLVITKRTPLLVPRLTARCLSCASPTALASPASATHSSASSSASRRSRAGSSSSTRCCNSTSSRVISWAQRAASTSGSATSWTSSTAGNTYCMPAGRKFCKITQNRPYKKAGGRTAAIFLPKADAKFLVKNLIHDIQNGKNKILAFLRGLF